MVDPGRLGRMLPILAVLAVVFITSFHCVIEEDLWWHLRAGEEIAAGNGIPRMDTWSFPSAGNPYIDLHWLFQLIVHLVDAAGGIPMIILFKCVVLIAVYLLVYLLSVRRADPRITAAVAVWGAILASERFLARPEILTYLYLAGFLWLIARYEEGRTKSLWVLPLVALAWVNTEGLFVLGWVILACGAIRNRGDRKYWIALAACVVVSLLNPFTFQGVLHPFLLFTRVNRGMAIYSETIGELLSPFHRGIPHPSVFLLPVHIGLLVLTGLLRGRRPSARDVLLLIAFGYLGVSARRNVGLFAIVSTPILAGWCHDSLAMRFGGLSPRAAMLTRRVAIGAVAVAATVYAISVMNGGLYASLATNRTFGSGVAEAIFPRDAVEFLRARNVQGPLFHTLGFGGYLIDRYSEQRVFIDGRLEVHSTAHYARAIRSLVSDEEWRSLDRQFRFGVILVNYGEAVDFVLRRLQDADWVPVHLDSVSLVFVRNTPENKLLVDAEGLTATRMRALFPSPATGDVEALPVPRATITLPEFLTAVDYPWSEIYLGQFLGVLGFHDLAAGQYIRAVRRAPSLPAPRLFLAQSLHRMGRVQDARQVYEGYAKTGGKESLAP